MKAGSLFFRCDFRSPRLGYILQEILGRRLGLDYSLHEKEEAIPEDSVCLHYGIPGGDVSFSESGILRESGISDWKLIIQNNAPVLEKDGKKFQGDFFGAAFWLLSRYEEQSTEIWPDSHGRFPDEANSQAPVITQLPLVELWTDELRKQLETLGLRCKKAEATADFSIDWDNPTAYLYKGILRQAGGLFSDVLKANASGIAYRLKVLAGLKPDPYDNLGTRIGTQLLAGKRIFFWMGDYGKHDKGLSVKNEWYRRQIRLLSGQMTPGLHPSYASFERPEKLGLEKKRLEEILDMEIRASRFHFLRFRIPESYRRLEEAGFSEDFSMGFSSFPGFRAGTALPFQWFDLKKNQSGKLLIHPFSLMDSCKVFRGESGANFLAEGNRQLIAGKEAGFPVHTIFHNEHPSWPGWENTIRDYTGLLFRNPGQE
jgi:hypothetical protein